MDENKLEIVTAHPIGAHLDSVHISLNTLIQIPAELDTVSHEDLQTIVLALLYAFLNHPAARLLSSNAGHGTLRDDILKLISAVASNTAHFDRIKPLVNTVFTNQSDVDIWEQVYHAVTESTPPRKPIPSFQQTPWLYKTSSFVNSSEKRDHIDKVLRDELGVMYVDVPNFHEAFFGDIPDLETTSEQIFQKCVEGKGDAEPLFREGWTGWPETVSEASVLTWLADLVERLVQWAQDYRPTTRRPLAQPNTPLEGSVAKRKLDVGFVDDPKAVKDNKYHWEHILIPGELKSNEKDDTDSKARLDLARYVKEVFTAQPTRRYVLAFTLCGSWMRLWEFDRLGAIASTKFDIHREGQLFVSTILGFLWMNNDLLGFDPTIIKSGDQLYINIQQDQKTERLFINKVIRPPLGIVGRATTCWKAHLEGDQSTPFVIKDSWQYLERDEEGEMLKEALTNGVDNVARYYHHETVRIHNEEDDIQGCIRKGLDITKASNYRPERLLSNSAVAGMSRNSSAGSKRSSSHTGLSLPPSKRSRSGSASPTKPGNIPLPNRIHRRIVLRDYGKPIYKASSRVALLGALEGCIQGHESLYKAGLLHRDISINNLMMNEDGGNPSRSSFIIDLDLAIKIDRIKSSGAKGKTGTRAFMAIGVLMGEDHSFMDDLESFFWVLFWICIHYDGQGQGRRVATFDKWNWVDTEELATLKRGTIAKQGFHHIVSAYFTQHYRPLIPWVVKLRDVVFPNSESWEKEDVTLYSRMRDILGEAQNDPSVTVAD